MAADESQKQKEVISEGRKEGKIAHVALLMDICHSNNVEWEPEFQKYEGQVVLRGDIAKNGSGSYTVFAEQGSSASQMTAAKVMDITVRRTSSGRSISLYPGQNGRCSKIFENSKVRKSRYLDTSTKTQMAKLMVQYGRTSRSS